MTGIGADPKSLSRAERILIGMFAALLASGVVGFTAISGQLLGIQQQIGDLRTEMHREIGGLRTEMHREIGGLRTEMQREIGGLREELREELQREIGGLRGEIGGLSERMTRIETLISRR